MVLFFSGKQYCVVFFNLVYELGETRKRGKINK